MFNFLLIHACDYHIGWVRYSAGGTCVVLYTKACIIKGDTAKFLEQKTFQSN